MLIEQLTESERRDLFQRTLRPWEAGCEARRRELSDRWDIANDSYDSQIVRRIGETHNQPDVIREMARWSTGFYNLWKRCARKIAVAYKRRPRRRILDNSEASEKLVALYRDVGFDAQALDWQRLAVIMNRLIVLVVPREDDTGGTVIDFELVTGADSEVYLDPTRSCLGLPDVVATRLPTKGWNPSPGEAVIRTVDAHRFAWWDSDGALVREYVHPFGVFPGADMLMVRPKPGEWWDWTTWRAATKATIEIGMISASMGWTRKTQCRHIISLITQNPDDDTPDGQTLTDHERPLMLRGLQLVVNDLNTSVSGFVEHIKSIQDEIAEQMTGAASSFVDPDPALAASGVGAAAQHEAIKEVREGQIPQLERFERRMAFLICTLASAIGHEHAIDPELTKDLRITWPELAFTDTPEARIRVWAEETKFGISDQVEALMERDGISEDEAVDRLRHIAERRALLDEFRAARNMPADATADPTTLPDEGLPGESLSQIQGRAGGVADATVPAEDTPLEQPAADSAGAPDKTVGDVQSTALNGGQLQSVVALVLQAGTMLPLLTVARLLVLALPGQIKNEADALKILEPLVGFKPELPAAQASSPDAPAPKESDSDGVDSASE